MVLPCFERHPSAGWPPAVGLAVVVFIVATMPGVPGRVDPETQRIRVIFLGEVKPVSFPFPDWIEWEPKFTIQRVPCDIQWFSDAQARRFTRLYLPRTYDGLISLYDAIIFEDFTLRILPPGKLDDFQKSVGDEALGILLVEYVFWSQNLNEIDAWMASTFSEVFPATATFGTITNVGRAFYQIVREDPLFRVPEVSQWPMNSASHGDMIPRDGSAVHAIWKGRETAAVASRDYGQGKALQIAHGWDNIPADTVALYSYLPDLLFNEIFFVAEVPPPPNLVVVHTIRLDLIQLRERRESIIALIDFVDKFGADTREIDEDLSEFDDIVEEIENLYISSLYDDVSSSIMEAAELIEDFEEHAVGLKERALLWIYLVEWSAISATSLFAGAVVWSLMVRRRLYRAVSTTRTGR